MNLFRVCSQDRLAREAMLIEWNGDKDIDPDRRLLFIYGADGSWLLNCSSPEAIAIHGTNYEIDCIEGISCIVTPDVGQMIKKWKMDSYADMDLIEFLDKVFI